MTRENFPGERDLWTFFFSNFEIHCDNFLFTFVNTKSIYGFEYFDKLPFGLFFKIDDVANTEFKTLDPIHIPEGCTFPDDYKQCMEDYPGPLLLS